MVWTWHFMAVTFTIFSGQQLHKLELFNAVLLLAKMLLESESRGHVLKIPFLIFPQLATTSDQGASQTGPDSLTVHTQ